MGATYDELETKREQRTFWAVDGSSVEQVTGHNCAPANPEYWWVPRLGFSGKVGVELFDTEPEAVNKAIDNHLIGIATLQDRLAGLRQRASELGMT